MLFKWTSPDRIWHPWMLSIVSVLSVSLDNHLFPYIRLNGSSLKSPSHFVSLLTFSNLSLRII